MRELQRVLFAIVIVVIAGASALADGILIPIREPVRNVFSVKYHHVDTFIDGQAATTKVDQVFHNDSSVVQEGTYVFPLPKGAAIHKFSMFIGEQEAKGKMLDKDEARRLYESIVRRRQDPALLEYIDRNTFRASVYPIPANGDKRIGLDYTEVVGKTNSMCKYVYPLSTERFSSKPLEDVRVTIHLKSKVPISNIYSPSHVVQVDQTRPTQATVTWQAKNVKPDQDLVLYYSLADKDVGLDVLTFRESGKPGYFMLLASPKVDESGAVRPKNVVFVLDRTGSMAGEKIVQAKGALKYCLNSLKPEDRFNLITFNETTDTIWENQSLVAASKANVEKALDHVEKLDASGGTNLNAAVLKSLDLYKNAGMRPAHSPDFVVLITDGQPTVGEQNADTILKNAKERRSSARVFSFGVGYDVNTHLLDMLTEQTGGQPEYVLPNENIEATVSSFFASVSDPVLTDLALKTDGARVSEVYPIAPLPDLFKGSQLVIMGKYDGSGTTTFRLSGQSLKGRKEWQVTVNMPGTAEDSDFIPQIWAARKLGYLLDQVRLHRSDELIKEIVLLSKEWGIPTEFTSYLVEDEVIPLSEAVERSRSSFGERRGKDSGGSAVADSINTNALKRQAQVQANAGAAPMGAPGMGGDGFGGGGTRAGNVRGYVGDSGEVVTVDRIQNIGARTFYQRGSQWVDGQVEGQNLKTVKIKQLSDAHFKLLAAYPELAKYQRLGNMNLLINNQSVEIGDNGKEDLTDAEIKTIVGSRG